jgi:hypothetical protein
MITLCAAGTHERQNGTGKLYTAHGVTTIVGTYGL